MSIKKKIILIFTASFAIVAIFGISSIYDFFEVKKDFAFLKISDSIRSKTLQIRRHEKNFFIYGDLKEIERINHYFYEIDNLIKEGKKINPYDQNLLKLNSKIKEYKEKFNEIIEIAIITKNEIKQLKPIYEKHNFFIFIIELTFLEHPKQVAAILRNFYPDTNKDSILLNILNHLKQIDTKVKELCNTGKEIIDISREIDKVARYKVEYVIKASKVGILIVFPFAFLCGSIALFRVTQNIVKRLNDLMATIEKTGEGFYSPLPFPSGKDEVSTLIRTYNKMAETLKDRERQLIKKEEELIRHKKLAAIGTLASGVAHELTNPLNNIHLSAQILSREIKDNNSKGIIKEIVEDILSQSLRVKKIVGDLLEFARDKKPNKVIINLPEIIKSVYTQIQKLYSTEKLYFSIISPKEVYISVDPIQMERVFLNLFTNAIDAMKGEGKLIIRIHDDKNMLKIEVSDNGPGIPRDCIDKIFDPFFTTKYKGSGLGLSIVYNIIKQHHGKIEVSTSKNGTIFTIYLPRDI